MFFIGGINSIFPLVVYISLIWICLAIGYGNKLKGLVHSLGIQTQVIKDVEFQESEMDFLLKTEAKILDGKSASGNDHYSLPPGFYEIKILTCLNYPDISGTKPLFSLKPAINRYRGPPFA